MLQIPHNRSAELARTAPLQSWRCLFITTIRINEKVVEIKISTLKLNRKNCNFLNNIMVKCI